MQRKKMNIMMTLWIKKKKSWSNIIRIRKEQISFPKSMKTLGKFWNTKQKFIRKKWLKKNMIREESIEKKDTQWLTSTSPHPPTLNCLWWIAKLELNKKQLLESWKNSLISKKQKKNSKFVLRLLSQKHKEEFLLKHFQKIKF